MKKVHFVLLILISTLSYSQKEKNIWYFGNNAGLDFNNGSPIALTDGAMFTYDNCASISNKRTGHILFYSNGVSVWNQNHQIMPNGNGLLGHTSGGNSAFALKQPGNDSIYYLFTNDAFAGSNGLRYSIINMNLQGNLGDITNTKNVILLNPSTEKITAIRHANNQDIWIIAHQWNSNSFNSYLLSSTGLNTNPVVTSIGSIHTGGTLGTYNALGQITASKNGNKLVCAIYDLQKYELFDFDRSTGTLSNSIVISGYPNAWGTELSSDGNLLYTTQWGGSDGAIIRQFDISSNNQTTINNSAAIIGTVTSPDGNYKAGYLQMGPDNKIYVAKFTDTYLGVINNPNTLGSGCNYIDNGVYLEGKISEAGLPSFMQTTVDSLTYIYKDNNQDKIELYPNPLTNASTITIHKKNESDFNIELCDIYGRKIFIFYNCKSPFQIKKQELTNGIYFLKAFNQHEIIGIKKVIIQ